MTAGGFSTDGATMRRKGIPIFLRILLFFMMVNLATSAILIALAYGFNISAVEKHTKETIAAQIEILRDSFDSKYRSNLRRSLALLTDATTLDAYLSSSDLQRPFLKKDVERLFRDVMRDSDGVAELRFVSPEGAIQISAAGNHGTDEAWNLATPTNLAGDRQATVTIQNAARLFDRIAQVPLLLNSGYMEWFMPPRGILVEGPYTDEGGGISFLAGMAKIDLDTRDLGGVVMLRQKLDGFLGELRRVQFLGENPVWVYGADGVVLQAGAPVAFDPKSYFSPQFQGNLQMLDVAEGIVAYQDMSIVPGRAFMRIAIAIPRALLVKDFTPAIRFFSVILGGSIVVVFLVAFLVSRYLTRPIVALADAAQRTAQGDLDVSVPIRTSGEIQVLVDSFNRMTGHLRSEIAGHERTEGELRVAKERAEFASRAKTEFLANMSHELRTPLNSVIGFSDLMLTEMFGPLGHEKYREYLKDVHSSGQHLLQVISDILDISKVEAGEMDITDAAVSSEQVFGAVTRMLADRATRGGVTVTSHVPVNFPDLQGDVRRLRQILLNLISNAIKFTPSGGEVKISASEASDGGVVWQVADTGKGIPPEWMKRVLRPFEQVRGSHSIAHEGTGLGLYLTDRLVALHGGTLTLDSTVNRGTTVTVRFPHVRTLPRAAARAAS